MNLQKGIFNLKTTNIMAEIIHIGSRKRVDSDEIIYFKSDSNYTTVFLTNGNIIYSSTTLGLIEKRLTSLMNFVRINRGLLINRNEIITREGSRILLRNDHLLNISRRKLIQF